MAFPVGAAIIGGATLGAAGIGALSNSGGSSQQSSSVEIPFPNQTEVALQGQFGDLFQSQMSFEDFQEYFAPLLNDIKVKPAELHDVYISTPQEAYDLYKSDPGYFTRWAQLRHGVTGTPPEGQAPQYNIGQSVADYQNQVQGAADTYTQVGMGIWNDWMDFEKQYEDIYQAIGPAYDQINTQYQQNLASVPALNLGLPGGGSIPLAPKVHANMYSQQAQTQAGLEGQKFGQQMQATSGQGQGIGNRQNLLSNYYNVQSDAAKSNLLPVELGQWLLTRESNLRAGQPQTQASVSQPTNFAGTMLPALAMTSPVMANAFNTPASTQTQQQLANPYYIGGQENPYQYIPGAWG